MGQAPPRPQVGFSPESAPDSPLSTTPLLRAPARRDPRQDPEPGDLLELGGLVWRVTTVDESRVSWEVVEGPCKGEQHSCPRSHWPRTTKARRIVHRDLKSQNITQRDLKPADLSARDAAALRTLYELRDGAGWVHVVRRQDLLERSGLPLATWQRAVASLAGLGLVVVEVVPAREARPCGYQLVGQAPELAAALPERVGLGRVGSGRGSGSGSPSTEEVNSGSSKGIAQQEEPTVPDPRVGSGRVDHDATAALVRAIATLTGAVDRLLARLDATPSAPPALPPCERCQAPQVMREGPHGPFPGCSRYPACKPAKAGKKTTTTREEAERARAEIAAADERSRLEQAERTRALLARQAAEQAKLFPVPPAPGGPVPRRPDP